MPRLSLEIKIRIILLMTLIRRTLKQEKWEIIPERKTITKLYAKFCSTGSVEDLDRSGRPKIIDQNQIIQVEIVLRENQHSSLTEVASVTNVSRSTVGCVIHSELHYKSYKFQIHQKLLEEDFYRRVQTAEQLLPLLLDTNLENMIFI